MYAIAGVAYAKLFFSKSERSQTFAQKTVALALLLHFVVLVLASYDNNGEQLSLSFVTNMLSWMVTLSLVITNRFIKNLLFLPVVCFVSAFILIIDIFFPSTTGISVNMSIGMVSHILLSMVAFGLLSISMLYACQFAYINYQLKQKSKKLLAGQLPPLMSVEHILYQLMSLGVVFLASALATGFIFIPDMFAHGYAHKTVLSSTAMICYLACIVLHHFVGLKARVSVIFNFVGLFLLTLAYFGSRFVKEVILS